MISETKRIGQKKPRFASVLVALVVWACQLVASVEAGPDAFPPEPAYTGSLGHRVITVRVHLGVHRPYATERWILFAAHILASEAADTQAARDVTACTFVNDIEERGWGPWSLRARWYGWRSPDAVHIRTVRKVVRTTMCDELPRCLFVGNLDDLRYWRGVGMVREDEFAYVWIDRYGRSTVCVPVRD